jgi:hypothetical protein
MGEFLPRYIDLQKFLPTYLWRYIELQKAVNETKESARKSTRGETVIRFGQNQLVNPHNVAASPMPGAKFLNKKSFRVFFLFLFRVWCWTITIISFTPARTLHFHFYELLSRDGNKKFWHWRRISEIIIIIVNGQQGDQIGRIFAYWATDFFGQILENYISTANSWAIFSTGQFMYYFDKNGLGYTLGDFFHKLIWSPWSTTTARNAL